jgi:hypothetical protein
MAYLTGPVNTLADYQVEFNGFLMGPGTFYDVPPVWNFLDMAALKTMDQARTWADGSWSGPDFADVLLPSMEVDIYGATAAAFTANVVALRGIFAPNASPVPLWVKLPNMPALGIPAKTDKRSIPVDTVWAGNLSTAHVQWRCPDPVWQSVPRTVTLAAAGTATSGLVFPMFSPAAGTYVQPGAADFGSTTTAASSATLTNSGNSVAWPVVVIAGPTTLPCTVTLDGNAVTYSQPIPAGQTVTIDYKTGRATLTGGVDRTYALTSRLFSAVSASSYVFFSADGGNATVTVADMSR